MSGSSTGRSKSWSIWPNARVSSCARAICVWPSARPSWSGAVPMGISSSAPGESQIPAHTARPHHPGHPPPDRWHAVLEDHFGAMLDLASRVRQQEQRQRGPKVYALHAPEVECIGKGKPCTPCSAARSRSSPRSLHPRAASSCCTPRRCMAIRMTAIHWVPVTPDLERLTGVAVRRLHGDKGYRGHNQPDCSGSGSQAKSAESPKPSAGRCVAGLPSSLSSAISRAAKATASMRARCRRLQLQLASPLVRRTFARPVIDPLSQLLNVKPYIIQRSGTFFTAESIEPAPLVSDVPRT
jgi:hypothetical protein